VRLAERIDWSFSTGALARCANRALVTWLADPAGGGPLHPQAHAQPVNEVICARWIEIRISSSSAGELSFCHEAPFDRSSLTRWRQTPGRGAMVALIQESLSVAHKTGAIATRISSGCGRHDGAAKPSRIRPMPADATGDRQLVDLAKRNDIPLRQSYLRLPSAPDYGRPLHHASIQARPRQLKFLRHPSRPRHPRHPRKIDGDDALQSRFSTLLDLASKVRFADHRSVAPGLCAARAESNASVRARPARPMSSAARSPSQRPPRRPGAASCAACKGRCTAILRRPHLGPSSADLSG